MEFHSIRNRAPILSRIFFTPRYPYIFYGHYFICHKFGHKALDFLSYKTNMTRNERINPSLHKMKRTRKSFNNAFSPLRDEIEYSICNKIGHKADECRIKLMASHLQEKRGEFTKIWKKKKTIHP